MDGSTIFVQSVEKIGERLFDLFAVAHFIDGDQQRFDDRGAFAHFVLRRVKRYRLGFPAGEECIPGGQT